MRRYEEGTGLTFPPTASGFRDGVIRALTLFAEKPRLAAVQQRGMRKDFSWAKAAAAYEELYLDSLASTSSNENCIPSPAQPCAALAMAG